MTMEVSVVWQSGNSFTEMSYTIENGFISGDGDERKISDRWQQCV